MTQFLFTAFAWTKSLLELPATRKVFVTLTIFVIHSIHSLLGWPKLLAIFWIELICLYLQRLLFRFFGYTAVIRITELPSLVPIRPGQYQMWRHIALGSKPPPLTRVKWSGLRTRLQITNLYCRCSSAGKKDTIWISCITISFSNKLGDMFANNS